MFGVGDLEVDVAVQVVLQEPGGLLQGDGVGAQGQSLDLLVGQVGGTGQEAPDIDLEQVQVHLHLAQVGLVLGGGGGTEADGVAEVIGAQAGHDGVQIQHAQGLAGILVQQDVVELGVVVGHAQGQDAIFPHILQLGGHLLPLQQEVHVGPDALQTAGLIGLDGLPELTVAVDGVVEVGDRLHQGIGGELAEQLLELAEGNGGLIEILIGLGGVQAEAVDELVHSPELALLVLVAVLSVLGGQEMQRPAGIVHPGTDVVGDGTGIFHQADGVLEHIGIDALQHIRSALIRDDLKGGVDVAVAEGGTLDRLALQAEGIDSLFHRSGFSFVFMAFWTPGGKKRTASGWAYFAFHLFQNSIYPRQMQASFPFCDRIHR